MTTARWRTMALLGNCFHSEHSPWLCRLFLCSSFLCSLITFSSSKDSKSSTSSKFIRWSYFVIWFLAADLPFYLRGFDCLSVHLRLQVGPFVMLDWKIVKTRYFDAVVDLSVCPSVLRDGASLYTTLSQQDPEKSNITVGFFIVLYRIWALFTGTNKDKILSRALFEIFIKIDGLYPFFQCRFYWVFWKSFLTAYLNSWWNFHSFDRSHYIILSKNAISHF